MRTTDILNIRNSVPAPDGTPLGNLRHTLAVTAENPDSDVILRATGNIYAADEPGVITNAGGATWTGITLGDLRALAAMLDVSV